MAAGLVWAVSELSAFGHYTGVYGLALEHVALSQRRATDIVAPVVFDYRGVDTLGEEFILFAAAVGTAILLRGQRGETEAEQSGQRAQERAEQVRRPVRALGAAMTGPTVVVGAYTIAHGHLTPGGGFQGGLIVSAATVLVYAAGQAVAFRRVSPEPVLELADGVGAAAFALVAIGGLIFGLAALHNFLPLGTQSNLLSGGMLPLLNLAVGIEVAGAVTLIISEFVDQTLLRSRR